MNNAPTCISGGSKYITETQTSLISIAPTQLFLQIAVISLTNERAGELCQMVGSGGAPGVCPQSHFFQDIFPKSFFPFFPPSLGEEVKPEYRWGSGTSSLGPMSWG